MFFKMKAEDAEIVDKTKPHDSEHVMKELRLALEDPNASNQQKDEWKREYDKHAIMLDKTFVKLDPETGGDYTLRISPKRPLFDGTTRLVRVGGERVTSEILKEFMQRAGFRIGDTITEEMAKRATEVARELDEHLEVSFRRDDSGGLIIMLLNP
jgi:hypothetical protein